MHAISINFSSFEIMYNLQLELNDERNQSKWVKEIQYYKRCSVLLYTTTKTGFCCNLTPDSFRLNIPSVSFFELIQYTFKPRFSHFSIMCHFLLFYQKVYSSVPSCFLSTPKSWIIQITLKFPTKNVRKVLFNHIAFTKPYIKSDTHATRLLDKPLDPF